MQIIRARVLGMCMGVRRAEQLAHQAAEEAARSGERVFTYGPLIHNPQAVEALERQGVQVLDPVLVESDGVPDLRGAVVIIRAHGASLEALGRLKAAGARIIDATCPRVIRSQRLARRYEKEGWQVILVGDPSHGEITGILGHTTHALVVDSPETARNLAPQLKARRCALIAQTTIREEEYEAVIAVFREQVAVVSSEKTICPATRERQDALIELCSMVDAVVIIGGRNSANTRRLFTAAAGCGKPAWHIETAGEVVPEMARYSRIGLTAGASTPDFIVDEIETALAATVRP